MVSDGNEFGCLKTPKLPDYDYRGEMNYIDVFDETGQLLYKKGVPGPDKYCFHNDLHGLIQRTQCVTAERTA